MLFAVDVVAVESIMIRGDWGVVCVLTKDIINGSKQIDKEKALEYAYHLFFNEMVSWNRLVNANDSLTDDQVLEKLLGVK